MGFKKLIGLRRGTGLLQGERQEQAVSVGLSSTMLSGREGALFIDVEAFLVASGFRSQSDFACKRLTACCSSLLVEDQVEVAALVWRLIG
jgi:hypothetical protein